MATKTAAKPKAKTGTAVATRTDGPSPAMLKRMQKDSMRGRSTDQADNMIPLIYVLQSLSPQVLKKKDTYINGAEPGDIWLRNAPDPIVKGEEGIEFQPCFFSKDWVEWVPRDDGGGFVARHDSLPEDHKRLEDKKNKNKVRFMSPRGTEYIETRYHVGYVLGRGQPLPFVIPLSSTGHSFSKKWMFMINSQDDGNGGVPPSFARKYRLFIKAMSNNQGDWFGWDVEDLGWVDEAQYDAGDKLNVAFARGAKTMEAPERGEAGEDTDM